MVLCLAKPPRFVSPLGSKLQNFPLEYVSFLLFYFIFWSLEYLHYMGVEASGFLDFQVEVPKVEPTFKAPFLGFTRTAEIWNSRACMIGLIGVFIVELVSIIFSFLGVLLSFNWECRKIAELFMYFYNVCDFQILNKGILQVIGVDIGKGLDLPLWLLLLFFNMDLSNMCTF